jgi:hypothetical protein
MACSALGVAQMKMVTVCYYQVPLLCLVVFRTPDTPPLPHTHLVAGACRTARSSRALAPSAARRCRRMSVTPPRTIGSTHGCALPARGR